MSTYQIGRRIICALLALSLAFGPGIPQASASTTLLPNGEQCFSATVGISGIIGTLGTITPGSGGTAGTYSGVAFTGGSGTAATGTFVVSGGGVTAVTVLAPGTQFKVGDVLSAASASIGNVSGFSVVITATAINGSLAGGTVGMFVPNTTTPKQTWQDANQITANTNPITLDANGCAVIYGTGSYRQQLFDALGNLVFDKVTTDTSATNNVFWAGLALASGTPNAIQVTDAGFNATDGSVINFIPIATNTGPTTLNPSSFGNISIVKDTASGPVALSGGEIAIASGGLGNTVSVLYSASQNNFHLQNLIAAAVSASTPLCGAVGLKITNDTTFPNSKTVITADQINMQSTLGTYITRGSPTAPVSLSVNFTVNGANGIDTGTFAASNWYDIYAIDNGVAPAGLGSLSATAPTMPSGYSYKCRLGTVQTDSSGNFFRAIQLGNAGQYQIVAGSNTANLGSAPLLVANGITGSYSTTSPTLVAATVVGNGFCAPPTATAVHIVATGLWKAGSVASVLVAPSAAWGGTNNGPEGSNGNSFPLWIINSESSKEVWLNLEATTIAWATNNAAGAVQCIGWKDKVNAS